ncbi:hypothetical protein [Aeromicrobium chenweiae]|uniref:Uncharacterized protein n=1 Tax=Aeromicrobium chenweiae TaxID=2079793 RepID=A0A2S0WMU4_9ACTN|nr:hypothetical protein [Aeromicrobium chenweiae]AWB92673.1 hypothetical protein C3E78_10935 [Aeromicrobium chenweiae]TGN33663.1 hypothetical protein E4L97_00980 [Aeromicrobium chenweiae]
MRIFKHPIKKLTLLTAFGGGYVLGAKAGRERYEQIREAAQQVKADPRVQQATAQAEDLVREAATKVTEDPRVKSAVARGEDVLRDAGLKGSSGSDDDSSSSGEDAPAPKHSSSGSSDAPKPGPVPTPPPSPTATDDSVNPLLADEHVALEDEVVYTSGPDIEESIDEFVDVDVADQPLSDERRDNA